MPTYNRPEYAIKNCLHLIKIVSSIPFHEDKVNIILSDNCSLEENYIKLTSFASRVAYRNLTLIRHSSNFGVGGNIIACYPFIKADYLMFCGDDDFLSEIYIFNVVEKILSLKERSMLFQCSIQGVHPSGVLGMGRDIDNTVKTIKGISMYRLPLLSHQLSGLTLNYSVVCKLIQQLYTASVYNIDHIYICMTSFVLLNEPGTVCFYFQNTPVFVHNSASKSWNHSALLSLKECYLAIEKSIELSPSTGLNSTLLIFYHTQLRAFEKLKSFKLFLFILLYHLEYPDRRNMRLYLFIVSILAFAAFLFARIVHLPTKLLAFLKKKLVNPVEVFSPYCTGNES